MLLVATDQWRPDGGGRELYLDELVSHLRARGRRVSVLWGSRAAAAAFSDCSVRDGVRPIRDARLRAAIRDARASNPALQVLALSPISGATHYQLHDGLFERAFAAERDVMPSRLRRAAFPLGLALNRHRQRLMRDQRSVVRSCAVMAFSRASANDVVAAYGIPSRRIVVERPGIDLSRFAPAGDDRSGVDSPGHLRLAFVGRNFALKGLRAAIAALGALRRNGVAATLTVVGPGATGRYQALAEQAGAPAAVRFVGPLGQDAIADLYRRSDVLLHPSFYDPFPRVVVEALACGCPVITSARCGASEVLEHGANGFVVDDPVDAAAIARFAAELADSSRRSAMRRAAARTGRAFDAARHFDRVIDWLDGTRLPNTA
jgi:UDP-glucose:(heptosyl)LPS alpha-1,3-glucosyltransferase